MVLSQLNFCYKNDHVEQKFISDFNTIVVTMVVSSRPVWQKRKSSTLMKGFVIEDSIGEISVDATQLTSNWEIIDVIITELASIFTENDSVLLALSNADNMNFEELIPLESLRTELPSQSEPTVAKKLVDTKTTEDE